MPGQLPGSSPGLAPGMAPPGGVPAGPKRVEPLALAALVLAFLPLVGSFFGFIGFLFILPTAFCAREAKKKIAARPYELSGAGLAKAGEILAIVCLGFALLVAFGVIKKNPTAVVSDAITGEDTRRYTDVTVGTCFNTSVPSDGSTATVSTIKAIDCATPHDAEVFVKTDSAFSAGGYPGEESVKQTAILTCGKQFESYTGSDFETTKLDIGAFFPLQSTWNRNDRTIVCFVYRIDGAKVTGSLKGSGL